MEDHGAFLTHETGISAPEIQKNKTFVPTGREKSRGKYRRERGLRLLGSSTKWAEMRAIEISVNGRMVPTLPTAAVALGPMRAIPLRVREAMLKSEREPPRDAVSRRAVKPGGGGKLDSEQGAEARVRARTGNMESLLPGAGGEGWLRGVDLNHRPLGYEPNELPGCSTPHLHLSSTGSPVQEETVAGTGCVQAPGRSCPEG